MVPKSNLKILLISFSRGSGPPLIMKSQLDERQDVTKMGTNPTGMVIVSAVNLKPAYYGVLLQC